MAGIGTNPGAAEKFRFRYQYLLVEIGTKLLREFFDYRIGRDFDKYLNNQENEKLTLLKLISAEQITRDQSQYLPPHDKKPDSSKFGISLLICLLRHVCYLKHPYNPVWYNPSSTDTSVEADIARLRFCRNWVWSKLLYSGTVFISEAEFTAKWKELSQILNRLNEKVGIPNLSSLINDAEKMDIDEKLEKSHYEAIETWFKLDKYYNGGILSDTFIFRYQYLLIQLGTEVLRKVFHVVVGNNVAHYLTAKRQEIQRWKKTGVITAYQALLLLPTDNQLDSSKFDITLLSCLLRNICGLRQPTDPVWIKPAITDTSVEADITRLRMCRNQLMLRDKLGLPKWQDLCVILLRLNNVGGTAQLKSDISNAANMAIDIQLMVEINKKIEAWHESDQLIDKGMDEGLIDKMFQLRLELNELGTAVLQKHFDYRVGNDFAKYLTSHEAEKTTLQWLIDTNIISKLQVKSLHEFLQTTSSSYVHESQLTLLPLSDQTPSSSYIYADNSDKTFPSLKSPKLDLSLLTVLLMFVCGLRAPNDLVWKEPSHKDMSTEADIGRLWQCRNRITLKHLDEENSDKLLNEMREILKRLGRGVGIEDDLFSSTGDVQFDEFLDDIHINFLDAIGGMKFGIAHFFRSFQLDDDAWTKDEEKVSLRLGRGILPNAKQLEQICERFGSSSPIVRKVCAYICNTLQMTSHHIKRCWPAYTKNNINLVTFVVVKDIKDKLYIDEKFGYRIFEHFHGYHSAETSEMLLNDIKNADKFYDEMDKIDECVSNRSLSLMHSHSNITLVAGSTVKSIGYMSEKKIIEKPCVVIYVNKKGYIPLGEEPFPTKLGGFDTDVRECVVSLFRNERAYKHNDNLLMGTSIKIRESIVTLGGFVEHPLHGLCGLTCAHVFGADVKHWSASDPPIDVFHPATNEGARIGKVVCALLRQDQTVNTDIVLFSIERRPPISGQFAIERVADLNAREYTSGSVLQRRSMLRGAVIIKFGSETGRTETRVVSRISYYRYSSSIHCNQFLVLNEPKPDHFAAEGDSGSLCFVEDDNGLHAIGVVVGGGNLQSELEGGPGTGICFITPLSDILEALNEDNTVQVTMKEFDMSTFQLCSNLVMLGTVVLQKLFDYRVGNDFAKYLASHEAEKTTFQWLIDTNRITKRQVELLPVFGQTTPSSYESRSEKTLIPPSDQTPSSSSDKTFSSLKSTTFDISLLTVLLRYVCGLRAPNHLVWKEQPEDTDISIEANINRLGQFRNRIMKLNHSDVYDVDTLWKELRKILTRLGRCVGNTDEFFSSAGDTMFDDFHMNMLKQWYDNDQRQIQIEQGYESKKDSDDDAWTIDEENVSVLLSEGILPNAKQLIQICEKFGSSSRTVRKVCAYICNTLQMTSHHIKRCWPAYVYDKNNENDTNLVTFVLVKDIEEELNIDKIFGYNIYELFHGSHSAETSEMMKHDIENYKIDKVEECVNKHSLDLMQSHSNITLIMGSSVKSIGYSSENEEIIKKPCIAIYVHKKGYIPLGEKEFPTQLDEFDTDVRECVVSLLGNPEAFKKHDHLLMGTSIGTEYNEYAGTLGGFVNHSKHGLCGLTCAHVVNDGSPGPTDVFQPGSSEKEKIGEVVHKLYIHDQPFGLDVALVKISKRPPSSGDFAIEKVADFRLNEYNSGNVMNWRNIQKGAACIKFGSKTGRTEAQLKSGLGVFNDGFRTFRNQLVVTNESHIFADIGDSGSLAFVEDSNGFHAVGVVIGGNSQMCFLTPLCVILDALKEYPEQVTMTVFNVSGNEAMQE